MLVRYDVNSLNDPNFVAEQSFLKSEAAAQNLKNGKDTIRVDVLENVDNQTVRVYDIKTGARGLSLPRTTEIAREVFGHLKTAQRIIVTEIRRRR